ncbi:hypothetical protein DYB30_000734, partial [Aphanomyces astaci]
MAYQTDRVPILFKTSEPRRGRLAPLLAVGVLAVFALAIYVPSTVFRTTTANVTSLRASLPILTRNPIIGIHSHRDEEHGDDFIVASYLKWVESAGGRGVRIPYNATKEELDVLLKSVNGVLFPGGSGDPNAAAEYIYSQAIEFNNNGDHFPVWGTCLGFEWLVELQAGNHSILDHVDADNVSSTLQFHHNFQGESRLFGFSHHFDVLATKPITANFHFNGILKSHFDATDKLTSFYNVLATSDDQQGQTYVAAFEAKDYPIYAVQFHPEKNPYEIGDDKTGGTMNLVDHSQEAIVISQTFGHFFIGEARRNGHAFADPAAERDALLLNPTLSSRSYPYFESTLTHGGADPWNVSEADLIRLVASVNGNLFPGGDPEPSPTAAFLYSRVLDLNRNGTYFSLWGACLGFEWLVQLHTGDLRILDNVDDAQKLSSTLNLVHPGQSRLFSFSPSFNVLKECT